MKKILHKLLSIISSYRSKKKRRKALKKKMERLKELDPHNYTIY